jgi:hypothetical protein
MEVIMGRNYELQEAHKDMKRYSFSKLSTSENCGWEYYLTYILKLKGKQNIYGAIGEAIHEICEKLQRKEINNQQALELFLSDLDDWKMLGMRFPSENIEKNFVECISHFFQNFKPIDCKNYEIERGYDILIGQTNTLLYGFIDLITFVDENTIDIIDYKSSSKFSKEDLEHKKMQLLIYAYGCIKQYGLKIRKLGFNMLKYTEITWYENKKDKSTISDRNKIGKKLEATVRRMLNKLDIDDIDYEIKINNLINNNIIPEELVGVFTFNDYYIWVEYNEQEIINWVDNIIKTLSYKINEDDYRAIDITEKNSFYCNVLCSQRDNCKYYKAFIDGNKNNFNKTENDDLDDLL